MAKDKDQQQELEEDEDNKPNETILETKEQRDPDEAVFAEQAIHHYANDLLDQFRDQFEGAMAEVENFMAGRTEQDLLNDRFFLEQLGGQFLHQAMKAFGGAHTPLAQAVFPLLDGAIDQSARGGQISSFVADLSTAMRDATWYLRDNLESVLSNQWDELRDLAYEGSTEFIPALHAYGLPAVDFSPQHVSHSLIKHSTEYLDAMPKQQEESIEQDQLAQFEEEQKKLEEDPEVQNLALEEEEKEATTI
jgi:hypothetical protein